MKKTPAYWSISIALIAILGTAMFLQNGNSKKSSVGSAVSNALGGVEVVERVDELGDLSNYSPSLGNRKAYSLQDQDRVMVPPGNTIQVVESLRSRAKSGDAKAALAIYKKLLNCHNGVKNKITNEELAIYEKAGALDGLVSNVAIQQEECDGSGSLLEHRGEWLAQAADAGLVEAQLLYATNPEPIVGGPSDMVRDPDRVAEYKAKSISYLERLAAGGNIDAMMRLAAAYKNGILIGHNPTRSYAYYRAIQIAAPSLLSEDLLRIHRRELTARQMRDAEDMARAIYNRCCVN